MLLPLDDLNEMRQLPISLVIIAIIINGIYNHWVYKSIVTFLFEKGLTNRQKREWRKEQYFKRKTMHYKMILLDIGAKILLRKALYRRSYVAHGFSFEIFLFSPRTLLSVCQTLLK